MTINIHHPVADAKPVLVDSPHSGRYYPPDFTFACTVPQLRASEDFCIDELLAPLPQAGATVITAHYPRTYIDANRALTDLDVSLLYESWPWLTKPSVYSHAGIGLVHRDARGGVPIYRERLTVAALQHRIRTAYMPYHQAVAHHRALLLGHFGRLTMLNVHSMPFTSAPKDERGRVFDVVLGDRDGQSASPAVTAVLAETLRGAGLHVAINKNFKGGEIVRRYGEPSAGVHAIQIEFNRALYMDELSLSLVNSGVVRLRAALQQCVIALAHADQSAQPLAAE